MRASAVELLPLVLALVFHLPGATTTYAPREGSRLRRQAPSVIPYAATEKNQLLDRHNQVRRQEEASNMRIMVWDDALAETAQSYANLCRWEHGQVADAERPSEFRGQNIGQNLFVTTLDPFDLVKPINDWYHEKEFYTMGPYPATCMPGQQCGHYTQIVWADSYRLGCAQTQCPVMVNSPLKNSRFVVCNYYPPGNFIAQLAYKTGSRCSQCPLADDSCDNGICKPNATCGYKCSSTTAAPPSGGNFSFGNIRWADLQWWMYVVMAAGISLSIFSLCTASIGCFNRLNRTNNGSIEYNSDTNYDYGAKPYEEHFGYYGGNYMTKF